MDESRRIAAVDGLTAGQGIDKTARRGQRHIAVRRFDGSDAQMAVFCHMDIAFGCDIDTAGKRVQRVHSRIRCFHLQSRRIRADASLLADEVNAAAFDSCRRTALGQIAQSRQADVATIVLRLDEIDMARFAIGTVNGDVHIAAAGIGRVQFYRIAKGLDGDIRQALFGAKLDVVALEQAARLVDGAVLRRDGDGRARPAPAGLDFTGQGDIGLTRHIDGRIAILIAEEADMDAMVRFDTAHILLGRTRVGIPFGAFPMEPAQEACLPALGDHWLRPGIIQDHIVVDKDILLVLIRKAARIDIDAVIIDKRLMTHILRRNFLFILRQFRFIQRRDSSPEAGFMVMLVMFLRRDFLATGPVVAQVFLWIVHGRSTAGAEDFPVAGSFVPVCQVLDHRTIAGIFRDLIPGGIGNADQAVIFVADKLAHLQSRVRIVSHADVIGTVEGHNFAIARAGDAAAQINLAAVGIDIGDDQFLRRRIVVDIGLVFVGTVCLQDFAAFLYKIIRSCGDDRIGQILFAHARPAAVQLLDFRHYRIGNGDFVFAVAALDQAIDIDVRRIDVDVVTGNARTAAIEHSILRPFFLMDTGGVFITIGFVECIYIAVELLFVQLFRVAADVDDALGKALADALAGCQVDFLAVDFRRAAAFALQEDVVVLVFYRNDAIFRLDIAVNFNIGLRDEFGIDLFARLLVIGIDFVDFRFDGSRAVVALDGDFAAGTGGSVGADLQVDGSRLILIGTLDDRNGIFGQRLAIVVDFTARIDGSHISHFQIKVGMVFHSGFRTALGFQGTGTFQAACFHRNVAAGRDDIRQDDGIHRKAADRHQIFLAIFSDCLGQKAQVVEFVVDARLFVPVAFQSGQVLAVTVLADQFGQFIVACHQGIGVIDACIGDVCRIDAARSVDCRMLDSIFLPFDGFDSSQFILVENDNLSRPADDDFLLVLRAGRHLAVDLHVVVRLVVDIVRLFAYGCTGEIFIGIAVIPGILHGLFAQVFTGFICIRMDMAYTGDVCVLTDDDLIGLGQRILEFRDSNGKSRLVVGFRIDLEIQVVHSSIRVFARVEIDVIEAVDAALNIDFVGPLQGVLHIRRSTADGAALGIGHAFGRYIPVVRSREGDIAIRRIRAQRSLPIGRDGIPAGQVVVHIHPGCRTGTSRLDIAGRIDLAARFSCQGLTAAARKGRIAGIYIGRAVYRVIELSALHGDTAITAAFHGIRLVLAEICLAVRLGREQAATGNLTVRQHDISSPIGRIVGLGGTGTDDSCLGGIGVQVHMIRLGRLDGHVTVHIPAALEGNLAARIRLVVHRTGQITADHATTAAVGRRQIVRRAAGIDGQRFQLCLVTSQCDGRHIGIVFRAASRIGQIRAAGEKSADGDAAGIGCGLRRIGRYHVQSRSPVFLEGSLAQCHLCIDVRIGCCRIDDGRTAAGRCKALDLGFTVVFSILAFGAGCDFCLVNIESRAVSYLDAGFAFGRGRCHRRTGTAEKGNRETARFRRDSRTGRGLQACRLTTEDAVFLAVALRDENLGCTLVTCQGNDAVGTDQAEGATVRSCGHNIGLIGLQVSRSLRCFERTSLDGKIRITRIICLGNKGSGRHEACRSAVDR